MAKPFASSQDLESPEAVVEVVSDGVYALTAGGDPTMGAIEAEDHLICFEAGATPYVARKWLDTLGAYTDKPVRTLVLSHYHAVRVLGASAFDADWIIASETTARWLEERGQADWDSEAGRMPRLFEHPETIPGLTRPTVTFAERLRLELGGERGALELRFLGRGHTGGDIVAWLPQQHVLFAGDLVESEAALYTGDAFHREWMGPTLDRIQSLDADALVGGRGRVVRGAEVGRAIAQTRSFLTTLHEAVAPVKARDGSLKEAFDDAHAALAPRYGGWPIFEHCLPFDVSRLWDELEGIAPRVWTAERDREVWQQLQS